jgi:hypothetical protein
MRLHQKLSNNTRDVTMTLVSTTAWLVVLLNRATGERRDWKVKGKDPGKLYIDTGNNGPITLHVLLLPTSPVDYAGGRNLATDKFVMPIPSYSYEFRVNVFDSVPIGESVSASAEKEFGIVKFDQSADLAWFSSRCSCLDDPDNVYIGRICVRPVFNDASPIPCHHQPGLLRWRQHLHPPSALRQYFRLIHLP